MPHDIAGRADLTDAGRDLAEAGLTHAALPPIGAAPRWDPHEEGNSPEFSQEVDHTLYLGGGARLGWDNVNCLQQPTIQVDLAAVAEAAAAAVTHDLGRALNQQPLPVALTIGAREDEINRRLLGCKSVKGGNAAKGQEAPADSSDHPTIIPLKGKGSLLSRVEARGG